MFPYNTMKFRMFFGVSFDFYRYRISSLRLTCRRPLGFPRAPRTFVRGAMIGISAGGSDASARGRSSVSGGLERVQERQNHEGAPMHYLSRRNAIYLALLAMATPLAISQPTAAQENVPLAIKGYDPVAYFTDGNRRAGFRRSNTSGTTTAGYFRAQSIASSSKQTRSATHHSSGIIARWRWRRAKLLWPTRRTG